jgi:hypothetical protein
MRRLDGTHCDRLAGVHFAMPIKAAPPLRETAETSHTQYGVDSRDIRRGSDTATSHRNLARTVWTFHTSETAWTSTGT